MHIPGVGLDLRLDNRVGHCGGCPEDYGLRKSVSVGWESGQLRCRATGDREQLRV